MQFSPELDEETTNAIRILDSVVMSEEHQYEEVDSGRIVPTPRKRKNPPPITPRRRQTVEFETDRHLTEVSDGEAVEENFEKLRVWFDIILPTNATWIINTLFSYNLCFCMFCYLSD